MANQTIYPYGTNGQLPSSIGVINDLTTGGADKALSAEMGKRLALMSGTYAEAWARSKAITSPFCWLWIETVNGAAISKPIWHKGNSVFVDATGAIINVPAASVPSAPTIAGATSGSTVPKNTQITITPASGSVLYYSIDGGNTYQTSDSAVTLTLATAGSVSIVAYCANNAGNSSSATLQVTVAGTAVPTFSPNGGEVARGGSVSISVPSGGELHYKVNSSAWQTASGNSVSVPITGATTIQAYNVQDGDTSSTITNNYTMAALASPTFSAATGTEFPATGGEVELTGPTGATIYYTTDGSTPTTSSTQYTGTAIAVNAAMTIKAIAVDQWGSSVVTTATYTIVQAKIVVVSNGTTTMSLGDEGLTAIPIAAGTNKFTIDDLNTLAGTSYSSFSDHEFASLSFSDGGGATNSVVTSFDGGGVRIASLANAFYNQRAVTSVQGIVANGSMDQSCFLANELTYAQISGSTTRLGNAFRNCAKLAEVDLTGLDTSGVTGDSYFSNMFLSCSALEKITIGNLTNANTTSGGNVSSMFNYATAITDLWCTETTPPAMHSGASWVDVLISVVGNNVLTIHVPSGTLSAYQTAWGSELAVTWVEY